MTVMEITICCHMNIGTSDIPLIDRDSGNVKLLLTHQTNVQIMSLQSKQDTVVVVYEHTALV